MAITYPPDCNTPGERSTWLYRAQELLRYFHNLFGYWHGHDITQEQYDNPPIPNVDEQGRRLLRVAFNYLKARYPYMSRLDDASWTRFLEEDFLPCQGRIVEKILEQRQLMKTSNRWEVEIGNI